MCNFADKLEPLFRATKEQHYQKDQPNYELESLPPYAFHQATILVVVP